MNRSQLTVLTIVVIAGAVALAARLYLTSSTSHEQLREVDCSKLQPSVYEVLGKRRKVGVEESCAIIASVAANRPLELDVELDDSTRWRPAGRLIVRPERAAWQLLFYVAVDSGDRRLYSLRHRRGAGWAVVGLFDGSEVWGELSAAWGQPDGER